MSETTLQGSYIGAKVDAIGFDGRHAVVNSTVLLQENPKVQNGQVKRDIQRQLIEVLTKHRNNFGKSQLWVEGPISAINAIAGKLLTEFQKHYCRPNACSVTEYR
jgi:hypothetical protein